MHNAFCYSLVAMTLATAYALPWQTALTAGESCCDHCGSDCPHGRLVERTIYVPATVVETRTRSRVIKKTELRDETYTVFERRPETKKYTKEKCYLEDEVRTKTITEKKCHIVKNPVAKTIHVNVYEPELRETTVQREVCTECGKVCIEEPCTCTVMVKRPDIITQTCEVPDVVFETTKREISYCVKVPKKETIDCYEETIYKLVPVEKTRKVEVCVPEIIKEPYEVCVEKMIPKKILCCESCCRNSHLLH